MGKTCIVTGANSGIGRSTAITLAKNDYTVFATMRSLERGEKLREMAQELNLVIKEVELDVSDTDSCLLYTSPSPRDPKTSRMPSSA